MKEDNDGRFTNAAVDAVKSIVKKSNLLSLERMVFNEPNLGMGIYGFLFSRSARDKIFKTMSEQKVRLVIISGPPFSLFRLAPQIKNAFPK